MKKSFVKSVKAFIGGGVLLLSALALASCGENSGLGASVDTEAPSISISYPPVSAAIRDSFLLYGTWDDDKGLSQISIAVQNTTTLQDDFELPTVVFKSDKTWSVTLNDYDDSNSSYINGWQFPDGKYQVTVTAIDKAGHATKAQRTFEIDNTAPVVVLTSPGSTTNYTKYGSNFKVEGTIADEHTISSLGVTIYDEGGSVLAQTDSVPYAEANVATAGGTSISLLKFSANPTTTAQKRYAAIYGTDQNAGTFKYSCIVHVADNAKKYIDPTEGDSNATTGNVTEKVYLYDDVYESLMSANTAYDLSAADFMNITNGTYVANDSTQYDDNPNVVKGTLSTDELAVVESQLVGDSSVIVNTSEKNLKFSLNPAVNPTYTVSGLSLEDSPSGTKSQTVTFIVSPGLDGALIKPATIKVYLLNCGALGEGGFDSTKYADFVGDPASFAGQDGVILVRDFDAEGYDSTSVSSLTESFKLPEVVANNYYIIGITGEDADHNDFRSDGTFGFIAALSGTPPVVTFTSPTSQSILVNSDAITFKGTVTTTEVELENLSLSIDVSDVESGEVLGTMTASSKEGSVTYGEPTYVAETGKYTYTWTCALSDATGYDTLSATAGSERIYMYTTTATAEDASGNKSTTSRTVTADTVAPQITINSVTPSVTGYTDSTHTDENSVYVNGTITVSGSINEMNLNKASYTVLVGGEPVKNDDGTANEKYTDVAIASTQFKITIDTTALADDKPIDIVITAHDRARTAAEAESLSSSLDGVEGNVGEGKISSILTSGQGESFLILQETDRPVVSLTNADSNITTSQQINAAVVNKSFYKNIFSSGGTLTATITDDDGVDSSSTTVEYSSNGGTYTKANASYSASNNTLTAKLPEDNGECYIRITAKDTVGLATGEKTTTFYIAIDDGVPTFTSMQPADGNYYRSTFTASGTIRDGSGSVTLELKDSNNGTLNNAGEATNTSAHVSGQDVKSGFRFSDTIKVPDSSGDYTLTYVATDKYGQSKEYPILYTVDTDAPLFANFTGITADEKLSTNSPSISIDAYDALSGVSKVSVISVKTVDGKDTETELTTLAAQGEITIDNKKYTTYSGIIPLSEGANKIYVKVFDKAENPAQTSQYSVTVDTVAPTIENAILSTELINATDYSSTEGITVTATLKDSGTGVEKAWLSTSATGATYDAAATSLKYSRTASTDDWSVSLTIPKSEFSSGSSAKDGQYTYYLYAQDAAAKTTVSSPLTFVIDTTAPEINVFVLTDGISLTQNDVSDTVETDGNITSATYTISGTWKDVQTGTAKLEYALTDSPTDSTSWTEISSTEAANIALSFTQALTGITETETFAISFRAKDKAGNISLVKTFKNIKFDYNAPKITRPASIATQTKNEVSITGTVSDTLGIKADNIEIKAVKDSSTINAEKTATTDGKTYNYTLAIPANEANNGSWTISFAAKDDAGQKTTLTTVSVTLDTIAPSLADITATSTSGTTEDTGTSAITYFNGDKPLNLQIEAKDTGVGLDSVEYNIVAGHVDSWTDSLTPLVTNWTSLAKSGASDTWKATIVSDFASRDDGDYTIFVQAQDTLENKATPVGVKVVNDTRNPSLTESTSVNSSNIHYVGQSDTNFTLNGTVSDDNFSTLTYTLKSIINSETANSSGEITKNNDGSWSLSKDIGNDGGSFEYVITAKDLAGNIATVTRIITQDKTPPEVSISTMNTKSLDSSNANNNTDKSSNLTFKGTAKDETSLESVTVYYAANGTTVDSKTVTTGSDNNWEVTFTNVEEGWYTLYAVAKDSATNTKQSTVEFGVDSDAPTTSLTLTAGKVKAMSGIQSYPLGADGTYTIGSDTKQAAWNDGYTYIASDTFTIGGTITDAFTINASDITLSVNGTAVVSTEEFEKKTITDIAGGKGKQLTWEYEQTITNDTENKEYKYKLTTADNSGNSKEYIFIVQIDTQGPSISITSPVNGSGRTTEGALPLVFVASDSGTGVSSVTYTVKKGTETVGSGTATAENGSRYTASVTISEANQGELTISAVAEDYLDHKASATDVKFYYDNTPPALSEVKITTSSPTGYTNYNTNSIDITATVTDAISGVETVTYELDNESTARAMTMTEGGSTDAGESATYTATVNCADGPHTITVIANDKYNNPSNVVISQFIVDTIKPVFSDILITDTAETPNAIENGVSNKAVKFSGTITEKNDIESLTLSATLVSGDGSSVTNVEVANLPALTLSDDKKAFSFTLPADATEGTWEFTLTAIDAAGNKQTATTGILLDRTPPTFQSATTPETYAPKVGSKVYNSESWYKDTQLNITGYFYEAAKKVGSGVKEITYHRGNETGDEWHSIDFSGTNGYVRFKDEIANIENNTTIQFKATDEAGNSSAGSLTFKIDETKPVFKEYTEPSSSYKYSFLEAVKSNGKDDKTIKFLVYDTEGKLKEDTITLTIDSNTGIKKDSSGVDISVSETTVDGETYSLVTIVVKGTTSLSDSSYLAGLNNKALGISCYLEDNAGNSQTGTVATIEIDTTPPEVKISSVTPLVDSTKINKTVKIVGKATDTNKIQDVALTVTAGSNPSKTYKISDNDTLVFSYSSDDSEWTANIGTTEFYKDTDSLAFSISVVATDEAGNTTAEANAAKRTVTIDQNTDRPTVKVTSFTKLSSTYVLKDATNAEVSGTITDDDKSDEAIVTQFYVTKAAIDSLSGWTTTKETDTFTATHATYGTTKLTLSTGEWTYTPAEDDQNDGAYSLYFYVVDNAGTAFYSTATSQLDRPYWQFKAETKADAIGGVGYLVDGTNPAVNSAEAYTYEDDSGTKSYVTDNSGNAQIETVGADFKVGGSKKRYVKFVLKASDANGVASMSLSLSQNGTDKVTLKTSDSGSDTFSGTSGSADAVWTTSLIDISALATGAVTLKVVPVDKCGKEGKETYTFYIDNTGPKINVSTPRSTDEQNGTVTVSGTATDVGTAGTSEIQFVIPNAGVSESAAASQTYSGNLVSTASASAWSFAFDNSTNGNNTLSSYIQRESATQTYAVELKSGSVNDSTDIWTIPIWFKATDEFGNEDYETGYSLIYNPNADMPVTSIIYPSQSDYTDPTSSTSYAVIGGTIRVTGSVAIESTEVSVGAVFLQIADMTGKTDPTTADWTSVTIATKDGLTPLYNSDTNNTLLTYLQTGKQLTNIASIVNANSSWWGVATTSKSGSWSINLNANNKLQPESGTTDIAIRACAVNSNGKMGSWSTPTVIHIDADAPTLTYKLKQFKTGNTISHSSTANAEKAYEAGMYLRNPNSDWYLEIYAADTTGIDSVAVSGSTSITSCTTENYNASVTKNGSTTTVTNKYIYIPVGKLTETSFTVSATDKDTGTPHTTTMTYKLYIDNDAPTMGELTETSTKAQIAYTKIRNSNYNVSLSATATDSVSGFNMLAYYFKRSDGNTTTIELPVKTKSSGNNEKAVWKKATSPAVMTVADSAPSLANSGSAGTEVGLNTDDSDDDSGLYGVKLTGAIRSDETTFEHSLVSGYVSKGVIAPGSLMRIGGNYVVIESISGNVVTLSTKISTDYKDAFFAMAFIVDHAGESSTWSEGNNTLESDDGDGIYEKLQTSSWTSEFCSDGLEDGPISIMCAAFDVAENVAKQETKVMIANNTPRLTKVFLATDLNGDSKFAENEFVNGSVYLSRTTDTAAAAAKSYLSALSTGTEKSTSIVTVGAKGDWSDSNGSETLTDKLFRLSGNSVVAFEFVSGYEGYGEGNNDIAAYMSVGSALTEPDGTESHNIGDIGSLSSLTGQTVTYEGATASTVRGIAVDSTKFNSDNTTAGKLTTYGDYTESTYNTTTNTANDVEQYLSFTLWDSTKGTTVGVADKNLGESGVVFGSQYTVVNIPVYFDFVDDRKPVPAFKDPTAETAATGHVELGTTLPAANFKTTTTSGEFDRDTKISGKVMFTGTVSDEKKINSISLKSGKQLGSTSGAQLGLTVREVAKFTDDGLLAVTSAASADDSWKFAINETTAAEQFSITDGHKVTWTLTVDSSAVTGYAAADVLFTLTASDGTNSDAATYQVDIVPYITRVTGTNRATGTDTAKIAAGGDGTENINRSKLGHYPVSQGENLTISGFNLVGVSVTVGGSTTTSTTNNGSTTFDVPARSGALKVTVSGIESLNNVNGNPTISDNVATAGDYDNNLESYKVKGSSQVYHATDDRYLEVWNLGNYFKNTDGGADVSKPVMTADASGNLYASWVAQSNSIVAFSYGMTNNYTPIFRCYDQPAVLNSIAFDTKGTSGAASVGFMPEHQGQSGTFSSYAMSDTKIIGGAGAISVPKDYINNKTVLSGTAITVTGNPVFNVDSSNTTAYYNLANYDMNRRLGSFTSPKSARFNNFLHTIWYDEVTESIKYSVVNTSQKDDFNQNGGAVAGWVVIDGGYTGQDRIHDWTKVNTGYANNTLYSSTNKDEHSKMGTEGGTWANYPYDIFYSATTDPKTATQNALTVSSGYTLIYGANSGVAHAIEVGDSVALINNDIGSYAITITSISAAQGNNGYQVKFKDAPSHKVTSATVYQGNMNVVGGNAVRNINNFNPASNQSSSAGSSADMDVDSNGRPVIAYLDSTNSTLRVARFNTGSTVDLANMKLAANWTRTVVSNTTCSGEVSMRIDGANNIHILYQDQDGNLCYTFGIPNGNSYTFKDPETVDTTGTMSYGSISIKAVTVNGTTTYTPVASYLNKSGTAQGLKYAYRTSAPTANGTFGSADNWDYMILPAISSSTHYPVGENRISLEARKTGWTGTGTTVLTNGGTNSATPKTVQAAVAFKSKQFETAYLLTEQ